MFFFFYFIFSPRRFENINISRNMVKTCMIRAHKISENTRENDAQIQFREKTKYSGMLCACLDKGFCSRSHNVQQNGRSLIPIFRRLFAHSGAAQEEARKKQHTWKNEIHAYRVRTAFSANRQEEKMTAQKKQQGESEVT